MGFVPKISSQSFDEYYQQKRKEFEDYKNKSEEEYKFFVDERDKEFSEHLKKNWESFQMMQGKVLIAKPKPENMPVYIDSLEREYKIREYKIISEDNELIGPSVRKIIPKESMSFYKKKVTNISFFGENLEIEHEDVQDLSSPETYNNKTIGEFWDKLNKIDFSNCIPELINCKESFNLNDWGYFLLIKEFCCKISPHRETYKIFTWYLMLKSGYNVKIGYALNQMMLLIPFNTSVYGIPYYEINHENYYVFEAKNPGVIKTYGQIYPIAFKTIDPAMYEVPEFNGYYQKMVNFSYQGKENPFMIDINDELKDYYNAFPQMKLETYFNSQMSQKTKESLFSYIREMIKNKNVEEAVHFLLYFTQNVFEYKTDNEQFGKEKIFFPDEVFYYKYSDCEDRAVFFAYLVRELCKLKVIGLDYADHIAVAVNFSGEVKGDYVIYKNNKYIVCDPTYINAPIGRILPKHIDSKATIIEIND